MAMESGLYAGDAAWTRRRRRNAGLNVMLQVAEPIATRFAAFQMFGRRRSSVRRATFFIRRRHKSNAAWLGSLTGMAAGSSPSAPRLPGTGRPLIQSLRALATP